MQARYKNIANELRRLGKKDQALRKTFKPGMLWDESADRDRARRLKAIVARHGWPTIGMVRKTASRAAWLIAQHAIFDPKFQSRALRMMKEAYRKNPKDVDLTQIAYLTDRILVRQGKPQMYGTQFSISKTGKIRPKPIKDKENLDARRKAMNLGSFARYLKSAVK